MPSTPDTTPSCMTVAVAVIVSEISPLEMFSLNGCQCHTVGQGHPKLPLVQCLRWTYQTAKYEMYI